MIANPGILQGEAVRANIVCYHSSQTKRVCRSALAVEASHLSEPVEAGDWVTVLLREHSILDLKNWPTTIEQRDRVRVTDARGVFDFLSKHAASAKF